MIRARARDLGIVTGLLPPGRLNAITDVSGVSVGYATLVEDSAAVVRTGVTAIWPRGNEIVRDAVFAGVHSFNGYGEMTGTLWIDEQGLVTAPICITNTYSVGVVRDAVCEFLLASGAGADPRPPLFVHLPVVAETYDGYLSDIGSLAVTREMTFEALKSAGDGPIAEGNVGGGAGMICHEFKGGTGTASRVTPSGFTVGALVQANHGGRGLLSIAGVPVGREIGLDVCPSPAREAADSGSIIVVLATDAPLIPIQCRRLARRATIGLARLGAVGGSTSGDIFIAFSTANHVLEGEAASSVQMLAQHSMTPLFQAAAEAVEEAILNALTMAQTMTGHEGRTAHALPLDLLMEVMRRYRWTPAS